MADMRDTLKHEHPDLLKARKFMGKLSTLWKELSAEEREPYDRRAKLALAEYHREVDLAAAPTAHDDHPVSDSASESDADLSD
jgi:hypothetical protein